MNPQHVLQNADLPPVTNEPLLSRAQPQHVVMNPFPFQFASLGHFDARVEAAIQRAEALELLQPTTLRWMRDGYRSFRAYIVSTRAERRLLGGELTQQRDVLAGWCAWLVERRRSRVTVRTYWRAMASICGRIESIDGMANPFRWFKPPRVGRRLAKSLTPEDARKVLLFVQNYGWESPFARRRNVAIVGCMLLAGLRRAEVWKLRMEDVEEAAGIIHIRRGKGRYGGKDRTAYLPPQLRAMLAAYKDERRKLHRATPDFFTALYRDRSICAGAIKRLFALISARTGVHVTPHMLRHTYATFLRQAGIADRVSMDLLGHEHLSTLQQYSHVFEPEYLRAVERLSIDLD